VSPLTWSDHADRGAIVVPAVRRQRSLDRPGGLNKGVFLALGR
jgi:hypothetical protein